MIWYLLATYYLGGGLHGVSGSLLTIDAVKQLSEMTEVIISEPARAEAAKQTLQELKGEIRKFERKFSKQRGRFIEVYMDHDSGENQSIDLFNELNADWEAMQAQAIELRFQLHDQMTEDEWDALFTE